MDEEKLNRLPPDVKKQFLILAVNLLQRAALALKEMPQVEEIWIATTDSVLKKSKGRR